MKARDLETNVVAESWISMVSKNDGRIISFQIIFEGCTGVSYRGDIAIDDVVITEGPCPDYGNCDFERDKCGYTNKPGIDQFDWLLGNGGTSSSTTGPTSDHTTKTALGPSQMFCIYLIYFLLLELL